MKDFIGHDFLISNVTGQKLYDQYAKDMPIYDFHNHLDAGEILNRKRFQNITELWLGGDHYKWRAMRILGIEEKYITGDANDFEKFEKWAWALERLPGNPLYHWTHLELQTYFGIHEPLTSKNARKIYDACNKQIQSEECNALDLLLRLKVKVCCTTNEPNETLEDHRAIREQNLPIRVLPTYRPDRIIEIGQSGWLNAVKEMEEAYQVPVSGLEDLKKVVELSIRRFAEAGARAADHGISFFEYSRGEGADAIVKKALAGKELTAQEISVFKGEIQHFLGTKYQEAGWVMQLHLGALRNNSTAKFLALGPNIGCDSDGDQTDPSTISRFLDDLEKTGSLPKTVLYGLNPNDLPVLATMAANFTESGVPGKVQLGAAWWTNDHLRGIESQLDQLLETGLISTFIGMLTDSRSFVSFSRHDFFRRILCNKLGKLVENGEYVNDLELLGGIVQDISYRNAAGFFG
jgi:glucuronate isomerase